MNFLERLYEQIVGGPKYTLKKSFEEQLRLYKRNQKSPGSHGGPKPDLRFDISGDEKLSTIMLQEIADIIGIKVKIRAFPPGTEDARSGKFTTYRIESKDALIYIVDSMIAGKSGIKKFTPKAFGLAGQSFSSPKDFYNKVFPQLAKKEEDLEVRKYLSLLLDTIRTGKLTDAGNVVYVQKDEEYNVNVSLSSKNAILNDFGEILGAMLFCRKEKKPIKFPAESNNPLVDFFSGDDPISMKAGSGAAGSLATVTTDEFMKKAKSPQLVNLLRIVKEEEMLNGYLKIAQMFSPDWNGWKGLQKITGEIDTDMTPGEIKQQMSYALNMLYQQGKAESTLRKFYESIATGAKEIKYDPKSEQAQGGAGYLIGPFINGLVKYLNRRDDLTEALSKFLNRINVQQIHVYEEKDRLRFVLKPFSTAQFEFDSPSTSVNTLNKKLSFKAA
jgi:hypothetical protein